MPLPCAQVVARDEPAVENGSRVVPIASWAMAELPTHTEQIRCGAEALLGRLAPAPVDGVLMQASENLHRLGRREWIPRTLPARQMTRHIPESAAAAVRMSSVCQITAVKHPQQGA